MRSILAGAAAFARDVEALLLPVACLACERPLAGREADQGICGPCRLELAPVPAPRCRRCGQPLDTWGMAAEASGHGRAGSPARGAAGTSLERRPAGRAAASGAERDSAHGECSPPPAPRSPPPCGFCRPWPDALALARSAVQLDAGGPARTLVHALKYGGWTCAAEPMAAAMARWCSDVLAGADLLLPVPLGRKRQRQRGYNQAQVLAVALGRRTGLALAGSALERRRETRRQTDLSPAERHANVAGAFAAWPGIAGRIPVVVDDVLTTGATLGAVAVALAEAGAAEVRAVTFARAMPPR